MLEPEDRPEMPTVLEWAETPWRAWQELHSGRPYVVSGFSAPMGGMMIQSMPSPITWEALTAWCDRLGVDDDDRTEFVAPIVAALDRLFIAHWNASRSKPPPDDKLSRWDQTPEG
jgi:hypothetical protein